MVKRKKQKSRAERASDLLSFYAVKDLAKSMNVSENTVRNWVKGKTQPSDKNFKKVKRREYYYTKERITLPEGGAKIKTKIDPIKRLQGMEVFDAIRKIQSGDFDLEAFKGFDRIAFEFSIVDPDTDEVIEVNQTFINPSGKIPTQNDVIAFLYTIFRSGMDRYGGSGIMMSIFQIGEV